MIVKTGLQEFTHLDRGFELRDRIQFLERRRERIGKTPDRSRPEFLVLRFKVQVMYAAGEVLWGFQPPLDKCLVHDHLGGNILQFASRPLFFLGRGDVVGAELVRNPDVAKISFTGSGAVGEKIMRDGAATMKRVANDSKCGLHASVLETDLQRARRVASQIQAGRVVINGMTDDPQAP